MLIGEPDFKSVITLKGDSVFSDKGIHFVSIFDTIIVTDKIYGNDERFDCYSLRSLKKLGSFGRKGRGPGEFTSAFLLKHFNYIFQRTDFERGRSASGIENCEQIT